MDLCPLEHEVCPIRRFEKTDMFGCVFVSGYFLSEYWTCCLHRQGKTRLSLVHGISNSFNLVWSIVPELVLRISHDNI